MATTTMATMAILNAKCFKTTTNSKPIFIPKGLVSSKTQQLPPPPPSLTASVALAGAFFSALGSCEPAVAAQQIAVIAEGSDNRGLALLLPIIPALGWVLFNILQPALNQLNRMRSEKAVIVGLGLGGVMWAASSAPSEAAEELAAVADAATGGDNRGTLLLFVILPAIGWVLYNILQPALNQLNRMRSE